MPNKVGKEKIATCHSKVKTKDGGALVLIDRDDLVVNFYSLKFSGEGAEVKSMRDKVKWFFKNHATPPRDENDQAVRMMLFDSNGNKWLAGPNHPKCLWRIDTGVLFIGNYFRFDDPLSKDDHSSNDYDNARFGLLNLLDLTIWRKELRGPVERLTRDELEAERLAS